MVIWRIIYGAVVALRLFASPRPTDDSPEIASFLSLPSSTVLAANGGRGEPPPQWRGGLGVRALFWRRTRNEENGVNIIMIGAQGSGKGTQSEMLERRLGLKPCASGDLLRDHITRETTLGVAAWRSRAG
jgi:hypothetical protein